MLQQRLDVDRKSGEFIWWTDCWALQKVRTLLCAYFFCVLIHDSPVFLFHQDSLLRVKFRSRKWGQIWNLNNCCAGSFMVQVFGPHFVLDFIAWFEKVKLVIWRLNVELESGPQIWSRNGFVFWVYYVEAILGSRLCLEIGAAFCSPHGPPSDMRRKSRKRMALSTSLTPLSIAQFALPPTIYTMLWGTPSRRSVSHRLRVWSGVSEDSWSGQNNGTIEIHTSHVDVA